MELKETVEMMNSENYAERFKAEYFQLKIRIEKLGSLMYKMTNGLLDFKPKCPLSILAEQLMIMYNYKSILEERAKIEGIDLEEVKSK